MARRDADEPEGPAADQPMTLGQHLEELRIRLLRCVVYVVLAAGACYYFRTDLTALTLDPANVVTEKAGFAFQTTGPAEGFFTIIKIVLAFGVFFAGPLILLELWRFVATGLYKREKRGVQIYAPMSYVLFNGGAAFCYFVMLPIMLWFLLNFDVSELRNVHQIALEVRPRFAEIVNLTLGMCLIMGVIFQLPIVMLFTQKIGVITWKTYSGYRRHFVMGALVLAAVLTPTGDAVSLAITMAPIIVLFEGGVLLCRMLASREEKRERELQLELEAAEDRE